MKLKDVIINKKYRDLIPPLTAEQYAELKKRIELDGEIRDPLVVCEGTKELIDGHHRHRIATELKLEPPIKLVEFDTEESVLEFIWSNALGRRNLSQQQESLLRGKLYESLKRKDGGHGNQIGETVDVASKIAAQTGVSRGTVQRDGKLAKAVDSLAAPLKAAYEAGSLKLSYEQVVSLAGQPKGKQEELARDVRVNGKEWKDVLKLAPKEKSAAKPKPKPAPVEETSEEEPDVELTPKQRMEAWNKEVEAYAREVQKMFEPSCRLSGAWFDDSRWGLIQDAVKSLVETMRQAKGKGVCPACDGAGCKKCKSEGFVPRAIYDTLGGT